MTARHREDCHTSLRRDPIETERSRRLSGLLKLSGTRNRIGGEVQVLRKSGISRNSGEFSLPIDAEAFCCCHAVMPPVSVVHRLCLLIPMISLFGLTEPPTAHIVEKQPLFDAFPMADWVRVGGAANFELVPPANGGVGPTLVGKGPLERNGFLASPRPLGDFRLSVEVRIGSADNPEGDKMNSGIQIRSAVIDGTIAGLQVEIDPSERAWSGGVYHERGRGWLASLEGNDAARKAFRRGAWNLYEIECVGPRIRTSVNGVSCAEWFDGVESGLLAFQVHGGPACEVAFRAPVLEELGEHEWRLFAWKREGEPELTERKVSEETTVYPFLPKCSGVRLRVAAGTALRLLDEQGKAVLDTDLEVARKPLEKVDAEKPNGASNDAAEEREVGFGELRVELLWREGRGALIVNGARQQSVTLQREPASIEVSGIGPQWSPELLLPKQPSTK